jgi:methionyl aminopeptidase
MIILKDTNQINTMDEANKIVHGVLDLVEQNTSIGITTKELDDIAYKEAKRLGAEPAFLGYLGYPASICVSINEEIVHGIPGPRVIKNGDVVSIDFGVIHNGFVGDAAKTFVVGKTTDDVEHLICYTKDALMSGIKTAVVGNRLHDISFAISSVAKKYGYGNIKNFCGHGIGKKMHEEPKVLNYVDKTQHNVRLQAGMVLALEPMFTLGTSDTVTLNDGWTVVTKDKSIACHQEFSIAIFNSGPKILGV